MDGLFMIYANLLFLMIQDAPTYIFWSEIWLPYLYDIFVAAWTLCLKVEYIDLWPLVLFLYIIKTYITADLVR